MKEFKFISVHLNSKGELEVRAYPELPPKKDDYYFRHEPSEQDWYFDGEYYSISCRAWEQSAEVFRPYDEAETVKIMAEIARRVGLNKMDIKDFDVTDFVVIDKVFARYFAFYKSPKDQPEQTEGESQHPYSVVTIENAIAELKSCYKRLGYENSNVLMALEDLHRHLNQNS